MIEGKYSSILREVYQEADLDRCIASFLEEKFGEGWFDRLPIDLDELASDCGFAVREISGLPAAGIISQLIDGEILINASDPPQRRRFTLAHEIGHYLLRGLAGKQKPSSQCLGDDEETVCDLLASHILVPYAVAEEFTSLRRPSFPLADLIQRKYDISLLAALVTMAQRKASQFYVTLWEEAPSESLNLVWITASTYQANSVWLPLGYQLTMDKTVTRWALGYIGDRPTDTLVLQLNGERHYFDVSYMRYGYNPVRILALMSSK